MRAFIIDRRTFITKAHGRALNYSLNRSIYDAVSTVTVSGLSPPPDAGDFIFLDGTDFIGVISDVSLNGTAAGLSVSQIGNILDRQLLYEPREYQYLEDNLLNLIEANYINCPDAFYAYPYLDAYAPTHTAAQVAPDLDNGGVYTLKSYAAKLRRLHNIFLTWGIRRQKLTLDISERVKTVRKVDFGNPNYVLTEQSFSDKKVSKITTVAEDAGEKRDWVLLADGSVVNSAPVEGRTDGEWIILQVNEAAEAENAARDEFLKNEYSHKIAFTANKNSGFGLYDRLQIRLDGKLFYSYVTGLEETSGSDYAQISCGELQTEYPFLTAD